MMPAHQCRRDAFRPAFYGFRWFDRGLARHLLEQIYARLKDKSSSYADGNLTYYRNRGRTRKKANKIKFDAPSSWSTGEDFEPAIIGSLVADVTSQQIVRHASKR